MRRTMVGSSVYRKSKWRRINAEMRMWHSGVMESKHHPVLKHMPVHEIDGAKWRREWARTLRFKGLLKERPTSAVA